MSGHPLDRAVWRSLTTRRAALASGGDLARRLDPSIGVFVAAADRDEDSLAALKALVKPGETVGMIEPQAWALPDGLRPVASATLTQMVAEAIVPGAAPGAPIAPLTDADAPAMLALATLTQPGPFFAATHRLGGFVGIKRGDALVAMAGTRLSLPGYVEVSGVCTHPDHRGQGLAAALIRAVATAILAGGDRPFLTSYSDNGGAIALYEALGFRARRELAYVTLMHDDVGPREVSSSDGSDAR